MMLHPNHGNIPPFSELAVEFVFRPRNTLKPPAFKTLRKLQDETEGDAARAIDYQYTVLIIC